MMVIAASAAFLSVLVFSPRCQHINAACPVAASALCTPSGSKGRERGWHRNRAAQELEPTWVVIGSLGSHRRRERGRMGDVLPAEWGM